eukprot:gnl/TRDRNA2_/TRDRNA2_205478_c0_seq1.p2 gnl/TRDRNA2_/TRDRNA2_205478_c0~~gnl/TRDRNA2_/TRDRNA2_205478_c0_seq1.p2  ORF type:complete len:120 (-),score=15.03 gnl/TRDRNA2_/TRDRNA2_205478_c0_seq1:341-700(-)
MAVMLSGISLCLAVLTMLVPLASPLVLTEHFFPSTVSGVSRWLEDKVGDPWWLHYGGGMLVYDICNRPAIGSQCKAFLDESAEFIEATHAANLTHIADELAGVLHAVVRLFVPFFTHLL